MLIFLKHFQYLDRNLRAELPYIRSDQRDELEVSSTEIRLVLWPASHTSWASGSSA